MKTAGIIAEYNPFHRGHEYQIQYTKQKLGADYVIVAMSGDYVQRGTPALLSKHARAEMALRCGADLVLEMPVSVCTASAEAFAMGGISLLDGLGVVDRACKEEIYRTYDPVFTHTVKDICLDHTAV